jgi:hypothetical protein
MKDFFRKRIVRRRNRKILKLIEKLEKVSGKNVKTLQNMASPGLWVNVLRDVQAINFCADKALKLMRAHVGPRNLLEALVMIKKMAEYEQNLAKKRG